MKSRIFVTGRSKAGKSLFIKEATNYFSDFDLKNYIMTEVSLEYLTRNPSPTKPDLLVVVECSPLICCFRNTSMLDLDKERNNDQVIGYLKELPNAMFISNNTNNIEDFKVIIKRTIKTITRSK